MEYPVSYQPRSGQTPPPIVPPPSLTLAHCRDSTRLICQSSAKKEPYVNGLWGQFIFIWRFNLTLISREKNKDGGICFMAAIKNNQHCVFISQALTVSSGFWPTSWRGSSGRWSRRISVYSRMNTASPSLAHVATWNTTILSVACNVDLMKSHFFGFWDWTWDWPWDWKTDILTFLFIGGEKMDQPMSKRRVEWGL